MLEVAHMAVHVGQMTGVSQMQEMFDAVTINSAKALGLETYGLEPGKNADMVILQASDPVEAIRLRAQRLYVLRRGKVISKMAPQQAELSLDGEHYAVDFRHSPSSE